MCGYSPRSILVSEILFSICLAHKSVGKNMLSVFN